MGLFAWVDCLVQNDLNATVRQAPLTRAWWLEPGGQIPPVWPDSLTLVTGIQ